MDIQTQKFSNLNKIYWPESGVTKGDLINYYRTVAPTILPHLKNRPQSLNRFPNGVEGESFYQKNVKPLNLPPFVESVAVKSDNKNIEYALCNNRESLLYLINLGCIELNPWLSSLPRLNNPNFMVIDLDPLGIEFKWVVKTALKTKSVLDKLGIPSYPKTSGATGIHIFVPAIPRYSYDQVKSFAQIVANLVHQETKAFTSIERMPSKREGKVYIDFLQNGKGKTLASAYSVRPEALATISTPLLWNEVNNELDPNEFTIRTILNRINDKGDLFKSVLNNGIELEGALKRM